MAETSLIKTRIRAELKGLSKPTLLRVLNAIRRLSRQQAMKALSDLKRRTKKTSRK